MTIAEFLAVSEARRRRKVYEKADLHALAWLMREVKAIKGKGKQRRYYYDDFKKFFDINKELGIKSDIDEKVDRLTEFKKQKAAKGGGPNG